MPSLKLATAHVIRAISETTAVKANLRAHVRAHGDSVAISLAIVEAHDLGERLKVLRQNLVGLELRASSAEAQGDAEVTS